MSRFPIIMTVVLATFLAFPASAQQKCEGPAELCAQIAQLQADLNIHKGQEQKIATLQADKQTQDDRTVKFVGIMGTLAVVLKIFLSLLTTWKDTLFNGDKGKATIRIAILVVTLAVFLTTNMGFGIPWWQAMILAAGGPLSMVIHEMMKLIPVIRGKAKLPPDQEPSKDPPQP